MALDSQRDPTQEQQLDGSTQHRHPNMWNLPQEEDPQRRAFYNTIVSHNVDSAISQNVLILPLKENWREKLCTVQWSDMLNQSHIVEEGRKTAEERRDCWEAQSGPVYILGWWTEICSPEVPNVPCPSSSWLIGSWQEEDRIVAIPLASPVCPGRLWGTAIMPELPLQQQLRVSR